MKKDTISTFTLSGSMMMAYVLVPILLMIHPTREMHRRDVSPACEQTIVKQVARASCTRITWTIASPIACFYLQKGQTIGMVAAAEQFRLGLFQSYACTPPSVYDLDLAVLMMCDCVQSVLIPT